MSNLHQFYNTSKHRINQHLEKHKNLLTNGLATSYEQYRHVSGQVLGLETALSILNEALTNYEDEDFEDDDE